MSVDEATTRRVAHLARVRVGDDQLHPLARELSQILDRKSTRLNSSH